MVWVHEWLFFMVFMLGKYTVPVAWILWDWLIIMIHQSFREKKNLNEKTRKKQPKKYMPNSDNVQTTRFWHVLTHPVDASHK